MKFRTKPCEIEATKWTGENVAEIMRFVKNESAVITNGVLIIKTLEGDMVASAGDYIIRGLRGEYYPCKPDVFQKKEITLAIIPINNINYILNKEN